MPNEKRGLIGRKIGMTQLFNEDGRVLPCTVIQAGPCTVVQVKTEEGRDGYNALQLSYGENKPHRISKPLIGHLAKVGLESSAAIREVRVDKATADSTELGTVLNAGDVFEEGARVDVTGISKGSGFSGVMKKFNFAGFIRSHGTHEFFRHGGSIGTRLTPGFVFKGKKMPGQHGNTRVTVQNLEVCRVDTERNLVFVRGGVPGHNGALVTLRHAVKG